MIRINLLPHREQKRKRQQQHINGGMRARHAEI